jgi:hypothetical protein
MARPDGVYWVRRQNEWTVAEWRSGRWRLTDGESGAVETDFVEIGPRIDMDLVRPSVDRSAAAALRARRPEADGAFVD